MCGFEKAGHSDTYLGIEEPTELLALRFGEIEKRRNRSNAFFAVSPEELSSARHLIEVLSNRRAA
jgi:hypothetical protein